MSEKKSPVPGRRWIRALFGTVAASLLILAVLLSAIITQFGLGTGMGSLALRIDGRLFGATIAGPSLSLWTVLIGVIVYPAMAGCYWRRVFWVFAPMVLMQLGNGLNALFQTMAIAQGVSQFGLGLVVEWAGEEWLSGGGNLLATAGFFMGFMLLLKKAVFDLIAAPPPERHSRVVQ